MRASVRVADDPLNPQITTIKPAAGPPARDAIVTTPAGAWYMAIPAAISN
ncbi:hypothetical protein J2S43_007171 [Catenuloplanes nepalensis]|uniref:Uncharacterized protein n=1 Tax=Catenuloplanes nepalensis TaxID=587533 RepID=A0ABT9N4M7_9ACTN|nr:hypothetical protein [Catenuloplanes nepalensis]MDP9798659.1 hypothetical protein [Catenuloplanes nepalensis]